MAASQNAFRAAGDVSQNAAPGFDIRLPGAQLGDLIQINCHNRIRGSFRVSSGALEGFLFFDAGQLVHAACDARVGLDAMVIMLGWRGGSIEPCALPWPSEPSIGMGADALLLSAAQRLDEQARAEELRAHEATQRPDVTTKVVRRVSFPEPAAAPAHASEPAPERRSDHSGLALRSALSLESLSRLEVARVTADGDIQRLKAGASADLADTAFFCNRLASLVGSDLGLGPCRALAAENAREGLVVFTGRSIVGARGARRDLELVLAKVGLE